jgi:RNA polymerase sigma-70 factor (ECF subfamily)
MPDAEELAMNHLRDSEVTDLLTTLPPVDAALITLVVLEGYPVTEAAALLKLSDGAARTRLHRAKHKLRGTVLTEELI